MVKIWSMHFKSDPILLVDLWGKLLWNKKKDKIVLPRIITDIFLFFLTCGLVPRGWGRVSGGCRSELCNRRPSKLCSFSSCFPLLPLVPWGEVKSSHSQGLLAAAEADLLLCCTLLLRKASEHTWSSCRSWHLSTPPGVLLSTFGILWCTSSWYGWAGKTLE